MIDDFEDKDGNICQTGDRVGAWTLDHDSSLSGVQVPSPFAPTLVSPARGTSTLAAHTAGSGFIAWGGGITTAFHKPLATGSKPSPFDASAYRGFTFWAKGEVGRSVYISIQTASTVQSSDGGNCSVDCYYPFAKAVTMTGDWSQFTAALSGADLKQITPTGQTFSAAELITISFTSPDPSFDFWIDDIAFAPK